MKTRQLLLITTSILLAALSLRGAETTLQQQAKTHFSPLPTVMESKDNPITPEKTRLGKMLFYDTRLSVDRTVSCFKCHWVNLYLTDGLPRAIGNHYKTNPRNSPCLLNAAAQISEHWIGNRTSVEDQAKQSLIGPPSMGNATYADAEAKLKAIPGYAPLFEKAFPDDKNPVNADNFAKAVGAWERTLVTPSRFDHFLEGDAGALTEAEQKGLGMFIGLGCSGCHNSAYVGGQAYRKFGMTEPYWNLTHSQPVDSGRFAVTHQSVDMYVFKVPVLRNVEMTSPYFHDGSVQELSHVVRIMGKLQLGVELDDSQAAQLEAFLKSLTGQLPVDALTVPIVPSEN
jgi:cytochrome c peroxidase